MVERQQETASLAGIKFLKLVVEFLHLVRLVAHLRLAWLCLSAKDAVKHSVHRHACGATLREGHASLTLESLALVFRLSPLYYQRLCVSTRGDAQGQQLREKLNRAVVSLVEYGKGRCLDRC